LLHYIFCLQHHAPKRLRFFQDICLGWFHPPKIEKPDMAIGFFLWNFRLASVPLNKKAVGKPLYGPFCTSLLLTPQLI
jgi:hypothetical protein